MLVNSILFESKKAFQTNYFLPFNQIFFLSGIGKFILITRLSMKINFFITSIQKYWKNSTQIFKIYWDNGFGILTSNEMSIL